MLDWWKRFWDRLKGLMPEPPELFKVLRRPSEWKDKLRLW
jgi:hypothetical protein